MGIVSELSESTACDLVPPEVFQAPANVLDLTTLNPGDPVVVSVFLRDASDGEPFTVFFGDKSKPAHVVKSGRYIHDVMLEIEQDLPPVGQPYDVYYSFRGVSSPSISVTLVDSSSDSYARRLHQFGFFGSYAAGLMDSWLVPAMYQLGADTPSVWPVGDRRPTNERLDLQITRRSGGLVCKPIGTISYTADTESWRVCLLEEVELQRGDLLGIEMPDGAPDFIGLSGYL